MKHKGLVVVVFALLAITLIYLICWATMGDKKTALPIATPAATNQITFPTANDTLTKGQAYTLTWSDTQDSGPITIFLVNKAAESQGVSVSLFDRVYNIPNSGSYSYTVPANIPSGEYKFEIGQLTSDYFQVK